MIDYQDIYFVMRNHIASRTNIPLDKVIPILSTNNKPKGIYATFDVLLISDSNSYRTAHYYDNTTQEWVIVTHKDVVVEMSVRNGTPSETNNQMEVMTLANNLHKSFAENSTLSYLDTQLGASVKSLSSIRPTGDVYPTGTGKVMLFQARLSLADVTRDYIGAITNVQIDGEVVDGGDGLFEPEIVVTSDDTTSVLFTIVQSDPDVNINFTFFTKEITGRGEVEIVSEEITLPGNYEFDISLSQYNGDISIIDLPDLFTITLRTEAGINRMRVDVVGDVDHDIFTMDFTKPITVLFRNNNIVDLISDSVVITSFEIPYFEVDTSISVDFTGMSVLSNTVLNFN